MISETKISSKKKEAEIGYIVQVIRPVIDVRFKDGLMPSLKTALVVEFDSSINKKSLILEVSQDMGNDTVRTIAMGPTEGIKKNLKVLNTHKPMQVPVGKNVLGRMFNVLGEPIDRKGEFIAENKSPIYALPPSFASQPTKIEVSETGIKVIDFFAPLQKGFKMKFMKQE